MFYPEIQKDRRQASLLAFHDAVTQLDSLKEDFCKDCMLILRLLRDNLTLRRGNQQDEEAGGNSAGASILTPTLPPPALPHHSHRVSSAKLVSYSDYSDLLAALAGSSSGQIHWHCFGPVEASFSNCADRCIPKEAFSILCLLI